MSELFTELSKQGIKYSKHLLPDCDPIIVSLKEIRLFLSFKAILHNHILTRLGLTEKLDQLIT